MSVLPVASGVDNEELCTILRKFAVHSVFYVLCEKFIFLLDSWLRRGGAQTRYGERARALVGALTQITCIIEDILNNA
ncbi:hypothetical protein COT69_00885 [candidate division WWE3 bacterium CG09_land_8_20_14_0_10_39_24]|uniref:Uncharacterized protein n=2 Tax=Katanobacteria TaxID=422282 RepID=A0A2G9XEL8_UNCKA|nr:MAG: hypothetical protein AUJ94_00195 [bacterium CG2_30_40_12]OJI09346.1 MAG: hypothetical protein BK003_00865 [bacterium CG09_39_24]PIP04731.1 MAG: hypothetical protein COX53_00805 [candidate division WWE3 bacterium CG23_combo_of_CG06-09_8_20_14_all_40_14]PIS13050.1 MAG: hypothetical protein COT69_00885 [candidate division WWE3 bacterium CG09_land_8_20_14_0_10_39_24]PJE51890.1 MAG: hypothetical protein COV27_01045 [candidate division WWE3 bacterium CG10_big_fil_rev_8_21_14_0_10_39_14]